MLRSGDSRGNAD